MNSYRVHLRSAPGMWASYEGHVDVWTNGEFSTLDDYECDLLFQKAVEKLSRTSFPDRPSCSSWKLMGVENLK